MNREEAKKQLPIIQAYVDGKAIQVRDKDQKDISWDDSINPMFDFDTFEYRIKPTSKYRPFQNAEECWQEMQAHKPLGWVKDKEDGHYVQITSTGNGKDNCTLGAYTGWSLEGFFKHFTFADGSVFGVMETK